MQPKLSDDEGRLKGRPQSPSLNDGHLRWRQPVQSERSDLAAAHVVLTGGRGFRSEEDFRRCPELLENKLQAVIGAPRAVVGAGYLRTGQTGKVLAPDPYMDIADGISIS